jgi:hypothetical protein
MTAIDPPTTPPSPAWWERRGFALALILLAAMPLLWPAIPPLTDLPGHIAEYHVAQAIGRSPALARFYDYRWAPIGNLGVDLAVWPLAKLIGVEAAAKWVVVLIPVLTVAGMLATAREVHGRVPPSALLALPIAYAWPLQLGFVNFELAQGLAFCAFALWLRLARDGRYRLRAALFLPIAFLLWLAHDFGWGLFGLLAFGADYALARQAGLDRGRAMRDAVLHCLPLAPPLLVMLLQPNHPSGHKAADDWFDFYNKGRWLLFMLRDRWPAFDALSLAPFLMMLYVAARDRRLGFAPVLAIPALLCCAAFLLLPRLLLGGAYVDMRMAPAMAMLAMLAIRPPSEAPRLAGIIALAGLAFLLVRLGAAAVSFAQRDAVWRGELAAIEAIPPGATVLALVDMPCTAPGGDERLAHLPSMAVVRRDAFVDAQWALPGQQLLTVRYPVPAAFREDPAQLVYRAACPGPGSHFAPAIAGFDRSAFDYVWTLGFPPGAAHAPDLALAWTDGRSALYRVIRPRNERRLPLTPLQDYRRAR